MYVVRKRAVSDTGRVGLFLLRLHQICFLDVCVKTNQFLQLFLQRQRQKSSMPEGKSVPTPLQIVPIGNIETLKVTHVLIQVLSALL